MVLSNLSKIDFRQQQQQQWLPEYGTEFNHDLEKIDQFSCNKQWFSSIFNVIYPKSQRYSR